MTMADSQPLSGAPEGAEYLRAVLRAPVYEAAQVTPLQKMEKLSSRLDNVILVKREDRQPVHSFKLRGAYAMMAGLTEEQKAHGVITASAGNHAPPISKSMPFAVSVVKYCYTARILMKPKPKRLSCRSSRVLPGFLRSTIRW